jgi:hypothetical protein
MLTSFFGNSKTTNYILLAAALPFVLALRWWLAGTGLPTFIQGMNLLGQSALLIFALLLLDFIIRKNKLTQPNTFGLWWFFCGITAAVDLGNLAQALVLVFSLLSLRRIMSFANEQNLEKKIFDAALWILIVSVFYPWFLWMMLLLYVGIIQLNQRAGRFYMIPIFTGLCLWLIYAGFMIIFPSVSSSFVEALPLVALEFERIYWTWPKLAWLRVAFGAGVFLLITTLVRLPMAYREGTAIRQAHFQWIWQGLIMAMVIAGFSYDQKVEVFIWLILPLTAVLYANILELRHPSLLRELIALLPLALLLTQLLLK